MAGRKRNTNNRASPLPDNLEKAKVPRPSFRTLLDMERETNKRLIDQNVTACAGLLVATQRLEEREKQVLKIERDHETEKGELQRRLAQAHQDYERERDTIAREREQHQKNLGDARAAWGAWCERYERDREMLNSSLQREQAELAGVRAQLALLQKESKDHSDTISAHVVLLAQKNAEITQKNAEITRMDAEIKEIKKSKNVKGPETKDILKLLLSSVIGLAGYNGYFWIVLIAYLLGETVFAYYANIALVFLYSRIGSRFPRVAAQYAWFLQTPFCVSLVQLAQHPLVWPAFIVFVCCTFIGHI